MIKLKLKMARHKLATWSGVA